MGATPLFSLVATVHFVDKGVDTGAIVHSEVVLARAHARRALKATSADRVARAIHRLAQCPEFRIDNGEGLQYFAIHPRVRDAIRESPQL